MNNFCYIHVPFCTSKCKYCRFASFGILDKLKVEIYVKHLIYEITNKKIDFKNLKSIYFGGGTPSVLSSDQLNRIVKALQKKFLFDDKIEINIEATPVTISEENILAWKKIGINRLSIGVQTLNNESLMEIGRGEKGDILNSLNIVKQVGFNNVSVDFIIGLPYVKKGEIKDDIKSILHNYSFVKHISVYMLEEYYDVPEDRDSKFENIVYPNNWNTIGLKEEDYLNEYTSIKKYLSENGYNSYEISNFAKKGYECDHNQAYWNHSEILAFGLGAHGFINNTRYGNSEDFLEYYKGKLEYTENLNQEDIFLEKVMFNLRTKGLTKDIIKNLDIKKINQLTSDGYLDNSNGLLKITNKGILVMDYILKEIL